MTLNNSYGSKSVRLRLSNNQIFLSDWDLMRFSTSNLTTDMENTVNEIKKAVYKYGGIIDPRTGNTQFPNTNWNGQISLF